jgi:hypothetical protein
MSELWVTDCGSYGTGDFDVIDTSEWTDADWDEFEESRDWEKLSVAREIMWRKNDEGDAKASPVVVA